MNNYAEQIKRSVTMQQVCEMYGFDIDRKGFICCPFHSEKTPSMKIYGEDRGYHCFGCGETGDIITFVRKYFNLSFPAALDKLNTDFNLCIPIGKVMTLIDREKARKEAYERKRAWISAKIERERLTDAYNAALDRFTTLDKRLQESALKLEIYGVVDDDYIEAMMKIDQARAELDEAETRLWEYENRNCNNSRVYG